MIRVRTAKRKPRFFRGGVEFGQDWLTLTEPGDPLADNETPDLTKAQAKAIRAETRFLEVEDVKAPAKTGKKAGDDQGGKAAGKIEPTGPVNVNTATAEQIAEAANGIGINTARDLVKWRKAKGPFATLDDLAKVGGIGKATVERNREALTV